MNRKSVIPIVGLLAVVLLAPSSNGQIHTSMEGSLPGLKVSLEFMTLPQPLSVATIRYTIEVLRPSREDIRVRVAYGQHYVRVLSDTLISLPGPLQEGDMFSGTIDMVPLVSGTGRIILHIAPWMAGRDEIPVQWCLDEDGELHYLGILRKQPMVMTDLPDHVQLKGPNRVVPPQGEDLLMYRPTYNPSYCSITRSTFFDEDSVVLLGEPDGPGILETRIRVEPPFRMGDTSTVTYLLKMLDDVLRGLELHIEAKGFLLVDTPDVVDYPLVENQVVDFTMKVVPLAVGPTTAIVTTFRGEPRSQRRSGEEQISLQTVFFDDGSLRYITDNGFGVIDSTKLPQSFPPIDRAKDIQRIVIKSDD